MNAGSSNSSYGGNIELSAGIGQTGGGSISLIAGSAISSGGGSVSITTGSSTNGHPGMFSVTVGMSYNSFGQNAEILAGGSIYHAGGDSKVLGGSSILGVGGDSKMFGGSSSSGNAGHVMLAGGDSSSGSGGNVYISGGAGATDGSIHFRDSTSAISYGIISDSSFDFSGLNTVSISSLGTIDLSSDSTLTLSGTNGISMGGSNIYDFEIGSGTVSSGQVTLNKMAGYITGETIISAYGSEDITFYNSHIHAESSVIFTMRNNNGDGGGCSPSIVKSLPATGYVQLTIFNGYSNNCLSPSPVNFFVIS